MTRRLPLAPVMWMTDSAPSRSERCLRADNPTESAILSGQRWSGCGPATSWSSVIDEKSSGFTVYSGRSLAMAMAAMSVVRTRGRLSSSVSKVGGDPREGTSGRGIEGQRLEVGLSLLQLGLARRPH